MKIWNKMLMALTIGGLTVACSQYTEPETETPEFKVLITVAQMIGEEETTRAYGPMTPDRENSIRTLAAFQFDSEGHLCEIRKKETGEEERSKKYLFHDFRDLGDINGIAMVTDDEMKELSSLKTNEERYTCLIANLDKEQDLVDILFSPEEVTWKTFQEDRKFTLDFATDADIEEDPTLELGHVKNPLMFGFYHGTVPSSGFTVSLGRIMCRLKINLNMDGVTDDMRFFAALHNLERSAYFFVQKSSPHDYDTITYKKPMALDKSKFDLTNGTAMLQFYSAPHVGAEIKEENVTCLYLWCVKGASTPSPTLDDIPKAAKILLGSDPDNGKYELARNTLYSYNIKLKLKSPGS